MEEVDAVVDAVYAVVEGHMSHWPLQSPAEEVDAEVDAVDAEVEWPQLRLPPAEEVKTLPQLERQVQRRSPTTTVLEGH